MTERHIHTPVASPDHIEETLSLIDRAEALGYDHAWVPETWGRDAVSTLAAAASRVDRIGLGPSILNVYSRSPAIIAQSAVTLDELAQGPIRVGIGPSGPAVIERWHGLEYDRPLRRTRETAEIIRAICSGEVVEYDGELFSLSGFRLRCEPPASPPAVDLAGLGPKSVELAGFIGDGWHAMLATHDGFDTHLDHLERGASKAGRDIDDIEVTLGITCCVDDDGEAARDLVAGHIAFYTGGMGPFYGKSLARQGYESLARQIVTDWQSGDRGDAIQAVKDELLDDIAVAGTPDDAAAQLDRFASIDGVDAVAVSFPRGATVTQLTDTIEALAPR